MLVPIICFTCGCPIGDKEDLFNYLKAQRMEESHTGATDDLDCSDILTKLGIFNDCCKMHFISGMMFSEYY